MAAIVSVTDGVDDILATHLNQYAQTMNNIFNITDTAQANLGRLPLPWLTVDPAPANGLLWMRSNLGYFGRMRKRLNGYSVDHMGIRQRLEANQNPITLNPAGSGNTDISGCSIAGINTSGGRLRVRATGQNGLAAQIYAQLPLNAGPAFNCSIVASIAPLGLQVVLWSSFKLSQGPNTVYQETATVDASADWLPTPGTPLVNQTIKLFFAAGFSPLPGFVSVSGFRLIVEELDD